MAEILANSQGFQSIEGGEKVVANSEMIERGIGIGNLGDGGIRQPL